MLKAAVRSIAVLGIALMLQSCVNFGGKAPPPSMLALTPDKTVAKGAGKSAMQADALVVIMPDAPRKLDTNRLPVQVDASNIAYLKDALWVDKPARLIQQLLMEVISASNERLVLSESDAGGRAADMLAGSLQEFGLDAQGSEAVVIYDAVRIRGGKPVEKMRFEAREPVSEMLPGPAGNALNDAANKVAADVAAWLAKA
jgi:cholesterol transport system auxiliary component